MRYVGEHDEIRSGEVCSTQAPPGGANLCLDLFGAEGARQHGRTAGCAFQAEDARLAVRRDGQNPLVVLRVKVAFRPDMGAQAGDARFVDPGGGGQGCLSGGQGNRSIRFVDERVPIGFQMQPGGHWTIRQQVNLEWKRHPWADVLGCPQADHRDVAGFGGRQRQREQGNATRG